MRVDTLAVAAFSAVSHPQQTIQFAEEDQKYVSVSLVSDVRQKWGIVAQANTGPVAVSAHLHMN